MRISGSSIQLAGSSTSVEVNTKDERMNSWVGNTRPASIASDTLDRIQQLIASANEQNGARLDLSDEGREALKKQIEALTSDPSVTDDELSKMLSDKDQLKIDALEKMLEALTGKKLKIVIPRKLTVDKTAFEKIQAEMQSTRLKLQSLHIDPEDFKRHIPLGRPLAIRQSQGWGLEYDLHETHYEKQDMAFSAEGTVKTADGKEISLNLDLTMSREVSSKLDLSVRGGDAMVDPLVINYGSPAASLTNRKFSFDIDADGDEDRISFATGGSGFLAYDANNDGKINDGSELFGPQSGNGFNDLAKFDNDQNGWIDENDDIYSKLRIWSKDENGDDQLIALGAKGVGAIYLGNVSTSFDLKDGSNQKQGSIVRSGIFLKEDGSAGTIQHVDLAI